MEVQIPMGRVNFKGGKGRPAVNYSNSLPWSVQKWLNRSIYHLSCGLGCAEGSTSSIVFSRCSQCAPMGGHIDATQWMRLNRLSETANMALCQITLTTCFRLQWRCRLCLQLKRLQWVSTCLHGLFFSQARASMTAGISAMWVLCFTFATWFFFSHKRQHVES